MGGLGLIKPSRDPFHQQSQVISELLNPISTLDRIKSLLSTKKRAKKKKKKRHEKGFGPRPRKRVYHDCISNIVPGANLVIQALFFHYFLFLLFPDPDHSAQANYLTVPAASSEDQGKAIISIRCVIRQPSAFSFSSET